MRPPFTAQDVPTRHSYSSYWQARRSRFRRGIPAAGLSEVNASNGVERVAETASLKRKPRDSNISPSSSPHFARPSKKVCRRVLSDDEEAEEAALISDSLISLGHGVDHAESSNSSQSATSIEALQVDLAQRAKVCHGDGRFSADNLDSFSFLKGKHASFLRFPVL